MKKFFWAPLLHLYQPPTQSIDILKRINKECYIPLLQMIERNPEIKITLNISGVLIDLLIEFGLEETVKKLTDLVEKGVIEIVGTAKYHALLPLIQEKEIRRQIELNEQTNKIFKNWQKKGFFPPEMAISQTVLKIIKSQGYEWVITSGIACSNSWPYDKVFKTDYDLIVYHRDDIISNEIAFNKISATKFIEKAKKLYDSKEFYIITAMDGETFGHHIPNYEKTFLEKAFHLVKKDPEIQTAFISELHQFFPIECGLDPVDSSWSTSYQDLKNSVPYPLWKNPLNSVHKLHFRMLRALDDLIHLCDKNKGSSNSEFQNKYVTARYFYDRGIYSCPLWWGSQRPSWSPTLIYKGIHIMLLSALNAQLALVHLKISEGDVIFDRFTDYHHRLLSELISTTAKLSDLRTF